MATIDNYTVNIQVKGDQDLKNATASSNNLAKAMGDLSNGPIKGLTNVFGSGASVVQNFGEKMNVLEDKAQSLAVALVGIGIVEYIHKIAEAASQTKDLSEAFGIQISTVLELQAGFQRAGRDADAMGKMMTTLNIKALEAADGNLKVKNAFAELGVSFQDLKSMSMDQIMLKIGKSMEEGKGSADSIAAAMEVLGKSAKGVPWGDFVEGLERAQGKMGDAAHGVEAFDASMKQLEQNAADVRREFMILITPVVEFFNKMMEGSNHAKEAAEALGAAMVAIASVAVVKSVTVLYDVLKGLAAMLGFTTIETVAETTALAANSAAQVANAASRSAGLAAKVASLAASVSEAEARAAALVGLAGEAAAIKTVESLTWRLAVAKGALAEATVLATGAETAATAALAAEATAATAAAGGVGALTVASASLMTVLAPMALAVGALATMWLLYKQNADEAKVTTDGLLGAMDESSFGAAIMNATELNNKVKDVNDSANKTAETFARLNMKPGNGQRGPGGPALTENSPVLDSNKKELDQQAAARAALQGQYDIQKLQTEQAEKRLAFQSQLIGLSEVEKTVKSATFDSEQKKQMEIFKLQQQIRQVEIQAANDPDGAAKYAGQLTIMRNQLEVVTKQVDKTAELSAQLKMAEQTQQKYQFGVQLSEKSMNEMIRIQDEINGLTMTGDQQRMAAINNIIQAEARAEIKRREALLGNGGKLDWAEQIDILHQVEKAYDPIIAKQKELTEKSRDFETGWDKAFNTYMDDATNAAKQAGDMFNGMTNRMNSAIDNFVETGKFSFSDFSRSIIQDLIKIELKAQATKLLGALGGGGGIFSAIGSMLGFADGGEPPMNKPSIVGENGPEVFIPKTAGTIIPNGKLGGDTNNVTNHYITNNISAIDSKSVAQLFAENRKTLLGTVQLAQKELPYGNR